MEIKLQGIYGRKEVTKATDIKIGDVTIWNYGYEEQIVGLEPTKSGKSIKFSVKCNDGIIRNRLMRSSSYVVRK